jgi:hypothetical protein
MLLRHFLQKRSVKTIRKPKTRVEGFADQLDDVDYIEIQEKVEEYTKTTKFSKKELSEAETDGYELIQSTLDNPVFDDEEKFLEEDYDREPVDQLLEFISDIKDKYEEDEENTDEIQYILDLNEYINNTDE